MRTTTIPIIDVAHVQSPEALAAIDAAAREWGLFQLVGHGLDDDLIAALKRQMRAFFALPSSTKREVERTIHNPWGFYDRELTQHTRDWKEVYDYGPPDGAAMRPQWPAALPAFKPVVQTFYAACETLALRLLGAISLNLGMPASSLKAAFRPVHTSFLRLNYYPRCPAAEQPSDRSLATRGHLGVNPHTDAGALTLLLQDEEPGLEVFHEGAWREVAPRGAALLVNLGDIVQVWSNDQYRAPLHRARASRDAERFSAPFFFNPAYDTEYAPLPTTVDARNPARYRPIHWGAFRARRAAGDYADHGEYVQISHYHR